jgi:hypothetical protein
MNAPSNSLSSSAVIQIQEAKRALMHAQTALRMGQVATVSKQLDVVEKCIQAIALECEK